MVSTRPPKQVPAQALYENYEKLGFAVAVEDGREIDEAGPARAPPRPQSWSGVSCRAAHTLEPFPDRRDLVGTVAFLMFLRYLFTRLHTARAVGRPLAALGEPSAARVRALAWGMMAALAGTMVANIFYLTMQFYYFYAFAALGLALPLIFARPLRH